MTGVPEHAPMSILCVTDREGRQAEIELIPGLSVMETLRDSGFGDIMAICGGAGSCATCHVYVDPGATALPPMSEDEDDLLANLDGRTDRSRLACQLRDLAPFATLAITVAPEE